MADLLLSVKGLQTGFDTEEGIFCAVDEVSFDIHRGEIVSLLGESGCGKSLTALSLLRLVPQPGRIVAGEICFDGVDLCRLPEKEIRLYRGRRMAMIFQEPGTALNPVMTAGSQISEVIEHHFHKTRKEAYPVVLKLLARVGIPDPDRCFKAYPHQISGGMKQRVMIAMALAGEPDLLIADEPTTALDVTLQAQILELLLEIQKERGMGILLITHDLGVVAEMADWVAVMYAGKIVESRAALPFFEDPMHPYSKKLFESLPYKGKRGSALETIRGSVSPSAWRLTGCRFADRCDQAWELCDVATATGHPPRQLRACEPVMTVLADSIRTEDRSAHKEYVCCHLYDPEVFEDDSKKEKALLAHAERIVAVQKTSKDTSALLLSVSHLSVRFPIYKGWLKRVSGWVKGVDDVSFDIQAGKTVALVGESGCGKTTTGKAILQLIRPTTGQIFFRGTDLSQRTENELRALRPEFQIIFQDPYGSLNPRMTVRDIIREGLSVRGIQGDQEASAVETLLRQVGLPVEAQSGYPHEFSGGQRQRISIARALSVKPQLIVCDEPTSALDVSIQAQILNLLKDLQRDRGLAYLFITHNLSLVEYFADEILVMYLGRIVESGTIEEVIESPRHPYTQALLSAVPQIDPKTKREIVRLAGDPPSASNPPSGCAFHPRCCEAMPICSQVAPPLTARSATHHVFCHLYPPT